MLLQTEAEPHAKQQLQLPLVYNELGITGAAQHYLDASSGAEEDFQTDLQVLATVELVGGAEHQQQGRTEGTEEIYYYGEQETAA